MRNCLTAILISMMMVFSADTATYNVYTPGEHDDHYVNNAVMTHFKGYFYCMWQSSAQDEDSPDTHIMMSRSRNTRRWSRPVELMPCTDSTFASPGGWMIHNDTLTAFVNILGDIRSGGSAHYITSADGLEWSAARPVLMADGTSMSGILEQDPHVIGRRIIGAAHFKPGLKAKPIYTDDLSGHGGWNVGQIEMEEKGNQSRGIEPSLYVKPDGTIVMLFRDQWSSFKKMACESTDNGESWSLPYLTDLDDSRSKQCAGNLPDGTAFIIGNPATSKDRTTLSIAFSEDGEQFGDYTILRSRADLPEKKYDGKYKTIGYSYPKAIVHKNRIYVSYSENKERISVTSIRITNNNR